MRRSREKNGKEGESWTWRQILRAKWGIQAAVYGRPPWGRGAMGKAADAPDGAFAGDAYLAGWPASLAARSIVLATTLGCVMKTAWLADTLVMRALMRSAMWISMA